MGLPVIVTDIPGPTDAMRRLGTDEALRKRLAANARPFIETSFEQSELMRHIMEDRKWLMGVTE